MRLRDQTIGKRMIIEWLYTAIAIKVNFREFCVRLTKISRTMATMMWNRMSCRNRPCSTPLSRMARDTYTLEPTIPGPISRWYESLIIVFDLDLVDT